MLLETIRGSNVAVLLLIAAQWAGSMVMCKGYTDKRAQKAALRCIYQRSIVRSAERGSTQVSTPLTPLYSYVLLQ
jgi:hypothetical protein